MILPKTRDIDKWNRIKSPEINQLIHGQQRFDKGAKRCNGRRIVSSINCAGKTG